MESLVNYESDDAESKYQNDGDLREKPASNANPEMNSRKRKSSGQSDYEDAQMDLSENSNSSETDALPSSKNGNSSSEAKKSRDVSYERERTPEKRKKDDRLDKERHQYGSSERKKNERDRDRSDRNRNERGRRDRSADRSRGRDDRPRHYEREKNKFRNDRNDRRGRYDDDRSKYDKRNRRDVKYVKNDRRNRDRESDYERNRDRDYRRKSRERRSKSRDRHRRRSSSRGRDDRRPTSPKFRSDLPRRSDSQSSSKDPPRPVQSNQDRVAQPRPDEQIIRLPASFGGGHIEFTSRMERRASEKVQQLQKLGIELTLPKIEPMLVPPPLIQPISVPAIQSPADVAQSLQTAVAKLSGDGTIDLANFTSPVLVNPKYTEQMQKRKQLWANKKQQAETNQSNSNKWETAKFSQDSDGKVASKFMRLMGMKGGTGQGTDDPPAAESSIQKREEMFSSMEQQYEVARQVTHTMRGMGLGFGSQSRPYM